MTYNEAILKKIKEQQEFLNTTVQENIEKYRKGNAEITVLGENGEKVNAEIGLTQKTHEFRFGANIFMLDEIEDAEINERYKKEFANLFNIATVPFYWNAIEPEQGKTRYAADSEKIYRRPAPDLCIDFCEKHVIEPKLHCLAYEVPHARPAWLPEDESTKPLYEKRFREISERYSKRMNQFEVTNETLISNNYPRKSPMYKEVDGLLWFYQKADEYFPDNELLINEANVILDGNFCDHFSGYFLQIQRLLDLGARIDKIGMQHHYFINTDGKGISVEEVERLSNFWVNPQYMYRMLDTYSYFGKPIQFTEITFPTFGDTLEDEEVQAEVFKAMYSTWFSHPSMDSIIYWNLPDGYAFQGSPTWNENNTRGGIFHHDLTPKKSALMLDRLINKEWRTNLTICTDNGCADFRGFYGDYELEIKVGEKIYKKTISLSKKSNNKFVVKL